MLSLSHKFLMPEENKVLGAHQSVWSRCPFMSIKSYYILVLSSNLDDSSYDTGVIDRLDLSHKISMLEEV